ncbi:hypothetical protein [Endozoicomonas sp. ALD040]|uniref:hypothetical protein n=1 Tax=Endozoicomonas sp. ALD040 TaxID=3403079 RepID=UPI003BAFB2E6
MATPAGTANRPLESNILVNQDVELASELPSNHTRHTAIYSLHQCKALTEILSKMRKATIVEALPEPPVPSRFKSLKSRTVAVSSFWQRSPTDSGKSVQASKTEILAELDKMDECLQQYYQRICQLHSQLTKTLEIALQTETALSDDIPFYEKALQGQYENQEKLPLMGGDFYQSLTANKRSLENELHEKTRMLEKKNKQVHELGKRIQNLVQRAEQSENKMLAAQNERLRLIEGDQELSFLHKRLKDYDSSEKLLKRNLDEAQQELNRVRQQKRDAAKAFEGINRGLKDDLVSTNARLIDSGYEIDRLGIDAAKLKKNLEEAEGSLTAAGNDIRKFEEEKDALSKKVKKLEKDLAEANRNYQESIRTIREENAVLNRGYQEIIRRMQEEKDLLDRAYQETIRINQEQADHLNWRISKAQHTAGSHQDDDIRARLERLEQSRPTEQLENDLRQKATMLKATQEQLSEVESQKAHMLKKLKNMHKKLTAKGIDVVPKNTLTELQNNLQRTQSLLQQKEDEVTAWVNRSRQWETDRAALEREIETLRAQPGRFIQHNPTSGDESPLIRRADSQTV